MLYVVSFVKIILWTCIHAIKYFSKLPYFISEEYSMVVYLISVCLVISNFSHVQTML